MWSPDMRAALTLLCLLHLTGLLSAQIPPDQRRSGFEQMQAETRLMQQDDLSNPGMLAVRQGEALWTRKAGKRELSCADCHGEAAQAMRGVAARYPAYDSATDSPIDLSGKINQCGTERQEAAARASESTELLALTAYLGFQSRGQPLAPPDDPRLAPFRQEGRRLFTSRMGQLNLSCSQCHDDNWGRKLSGSVIPQGHANGYPVYRLEWQAMGSFARRLRNCMTGIRAEPFAAGSPEAISIELFLAERARGMAVETPAVRP